MGKSRKFKCFKVPLVGTLNLCLSLPENINPFILGRENVLKVTKTGYKLNWQILTAFWMFSQPRMNRLFFRLLHEGRHPATQV